MRHLKSLTPLLRLGMAGAVCLIVAWPVRADDARKEDSAAAMADKSTAVAAVQSVKAVEPAPATPPVQVAPKPIAVAPVNARAPKVSAETALQEENAKLQKMEAELKAVESLPLPSEPVPEVKAPVVKAAPDPKEIPKAPVKGLEEEYANSLYAMGKYDLARAAYQQIVESGPKADTLAWARLQVANCARHAGDLQAAGAAYEALMNASPASPWAGEAMWWSGEIKWWILWGQSTK